MTYEALTSQAVRKVIPGLPGTLADLGKLEEREIHQHLKVLKMKPGGDFRGWFPALGTEEELVGSQEDR